MAKRQSRRSISVRGATYWALRVDCGARHVSLSDHIEALVAADLEARKVAFLLEAGAVKVAEIKKQQQVREPGPRVLSRVRESERAQRPSPALPSASVPAPAQSPPTPPAQRGVAPSRGGASGQTTQPAAGAIPLEIPPPVAPPPAVDLLREPGPPVRRLSRQELADQRAYQRSGGAIPAGQDDASRSGRGRTKADVGSRPSRGALNVVLF